MVYSSVKMICVWVLQSCDYVHIRVAVYQDALEQWVTVSHNGWEHNLTSVLVTASI